MFFLWSQYIKPYKFSMCHAPQSTVIRRVYKPPIRREYFLAKAITRLSQTFFHIDILPRRGEKHWINNINDKHIVTNDDSHHLSPPVALLSWLQLIQKSTTQNTKSERSFEIKFIICFIQATKRQTDWIYWPFCEQSGPVSWVKCPRWEGNV